MAIFSTLEPIFAKGCTPMEVKIFFLKPSTQKVFGYSRRFQKITFCYPTPKPNSGRECVNLLNEAKDHFTKLMILM